MKRDEPYRGVLSTISDMPSGGDRDTAKLAVQLYRSTDSEYPLFQVTQDRTSSAILMTGLYQLQIDDRVGPAFVISSDEEAKLDAPWLEPESYSGWDTRLWERWVEIMDRPLSDGDPIALSDGETIVTVGALRSIRRDYPQGPLAGLSEMTIPSGRRMVVLTRKGKVAEVSLELGVPLSERGPKRYEATRARGWSPIHKGSSVEWEWRGARSAGGQLSSPSQSPQDEVVDLETLSAASQRVWDRFGIDVWWRGQSRDEYELIAPAHRVPYRYRNHFEHNSARHFIRGARVRYHDCPGTDDYLEWLLLMQHHGLPTRLMDWTESPFTAAFFACLGHDDEDGIIWAMAPYGFNQRMVNDRQIIGAGHDVARALLKAAFVPDAPPELRGLAAALHTPHTHQRMMNQLSMFTVHGGAVALESLPDRGRFLLAFRIPASAKPHLRKLLYLSGTRKSALFPELDSLADDVREYRPPHWLDRTSGRYGGAPIGTYSLDPMEFELGEPMMDFVPGSGFRINEATAVALGLPHQSDDAGEMRLGAVVFYWSDHGLEIHSVTEDTVGAFRLRPHAVLRYVATGVLPAIPQGRYRFVPDKDSLVVDLNSRRDWQD